ncbi:hypothetical protein BN130_3721 [Cronobacter malonaticus 507]|nr:hypothetical protein BN130_3721 [Cronobacter malonaticus 507]
MVMFVFMMAKNGLAILGRDHFIQEIVTAGRIPPLNFTGITEHE